MTKLITRGSSIFDTETKASTGGDGGGLVLVTDATVISNITTESNWSTGTYTGVTTGLVNNNYYIDTVNNVRYMYLNSLLMRELFNNFNL